MAKQADAIRLGQRVEEAGQRHDDAGKGDPTLASFVLLHGCRR